VLDYYANLNEPFAPKKNKEVWAKTTAEIEQLRAFTIEKPGS
jgi:hypothetical protein